MSNITLNFWKSYFTIPWIGMSPNMSWHKQTLPFLPTYLTTYLCSFLCDTFIIPSYLHTYLRSFLCNTIILTTYLPMFIFCDIFILPSYLPTFVSFRYIYPTFLRTYLRSFLCDTFILPSYLPTYLSTFVSLQYPTFLYLCFVPWNYDWIKSKQEIWLADFNVAGLQFRPNSNECSSMINSQLRIAYQPMAGALV